MRSAQYLCGAVLLMLVACTDNTVISEGDRVGTVTKLSHKLMDGCASSKWNWEGELTMAGGTNAAGQGQSDDNGNRSAVGVWKFSLDPQTNSAALVAKLREALNTGHVVRVTYRQVRNHDSCAMDSDYIAIDAADLSAGASR